jgi:uncharacterized low-complexity protein
MKKQNVKNTLALAVGAAVIGSMAATPAGAAENPFGLTELDSGYMQVAESDMPEGKCGGEKQAEGKCGGEKQAEGKCGDEKKAEGKCGDEKKAEGKCGEGKCGGSK